MPARAVRRAAVATVILLVVVVLAISVASSGGQGSAAAPAEDDEFVSAVRAAARARVVSAAPDAAGPVRGVAAPRVDPGRREALVYVGADGERITPARVAAFLQRQGSPLAPYADVFVEAGVEHDVDPRLVVAIAGIESVFGERQIGHNAWGWGTYGDNVRRFPDWPTAIRTYTAELAARYDTGSFGPAFAQRYCPPNWERWYAAVNSFFAGV